MWDFTDEKHAHIMNVLKRKAAGKIVDEDPSELKNVSTSKEHKEGKKKL